MKKSKKKTILGIGADIKSRFVLLKNDKLMLSQEFGNLEDVGNFKAFQSAITKQIKYFDVVAFDMHPGYFSSQLAQMLNSRLKVPVQHHHAHIASVLMVKRIKAPVIGVAFDGTGYGTDGNLWGGEFLIVNRGTFERAGHFKYLKMLGGERAVTEPWRMAFSLLFDTLGERALRLNLGAMGVESPKNYRILMRMSQGNFNSPLTSSVGRLFDAVASLLSISYRVSYEAEAAIKLQALAAQSRIDDGYNFEIDHSKIPFRVSYERFVRSILKDITNKVERSDIARKFHNGLAAVVLEALLLMRKKYRIRDVVLSGGVFSNALLLGLTKKKLIDAGFNLIYNSEIPVGDLSIGLGQVYVSFYS